LLIITEKASGVAGACIELPVWYLCSYWNIGRWSCARWNAAFMEGRAACSWEGWEQGEREYRLSHGCQALSVYD